VCPCSTAGNELSRCWRWAQLLQTPQECERRQRQCPPLRQCLRPCPRPPMWLTTAKQQHMLPHRPHRLHRSIRPKCLSQRHPQGRPHPPFNPREERQRWPPLNKPWPNTALSLEGEPHQHAIGAHLRPRGDAIATTGQSLVTQTTAMQGVAVPHLRLRSSRSGTSRGRYSTRSTMLAV
jgi:hypothetical protein